MQYLAWLLRNYISDLKHDAHEINQSDQGKEYMI